MAKIETGTLIAVGAGLGLAYYFFLRPASASATTGDRVVVPLANLSLPSDLVAWAQLNGATAAVVNVTSSDAQNVYGPIVGYVDSSGRVQSLAATSAGTVTVARNAISRKI